MSEQTQKKNSFVGGQIRGHKSSLNEFLIVCLKAHLVGPIILPIYLQSPQIVSKERLLLSQLKRKCFKE